MKKITFALVIVSVTILLSGCGNKKINDNKNIIQPMNQQKQEIEQSTNQNSTTTDETSNWKIYTNSKYGFSIKYPQNLSVEEEKMGEGNNIISEENKSLVLKIGFYDKTNKDNTAVGFGINVYNTTHSSLTDFKNRWYAENNPGGEIKTINEKKIGQFTFIDTREIDGIESESRYVYIVNNNSVINFTLSGDNGTYPNENQNKVLDQVLKTFQTIK